MTYQGAHDLGYGRDEDYGTHSPKHLLDTLEPYTSAEIIPISVQQQLNDEKIWVLALENQGKPIWSLSLPDKLNHTYSAAEIAKFSKG